LENLFEARDGSGRHQLTELVVTLEGRLSCPVGDFAVPRIHVNPQKVKKYVFTAEKSVTSLDTHSRWTGSTALLNKRRGSLNER
jgi:hypothetical protein